MTLRVYCSLQVLGTNKVIEGVKTSELRRLTPICNDIIVLYNGWIGYNHENSYTVCLESADGSKCRIADDLLDRLEDAQDARPIGSEFDEGIPYVGQQFLAKRNTLNLADWIERTPAMDKWLASKNKHNKMLVTVTKVTVSVDPRWLCCIQSDVLRAEKELMPMECQLLGEMRTAGLSSPTVVGAVFDIDRLRDVFNRSSVTQYASPPQPSRIGGEYDIENMFELNCHGASSMQLGDRAYYTIKPSDVLKSQDDWKFDIRHELQSRADDAGTDGDCEDNDDELMDVDEQKSDYAASGRNSVEAGCKGQKRLGLCLRKIRRKAKKLKPTRNLTTPRLCQVEVVPGREYAVELIATDTRCDVLWQDNTLEKDIPSYALYPVHHLDNHDYFPGDYVVENREAGDPLSMEYGVIQSVDSAARTATVKWFKVIPPSSEPVLQREEDTSVYDLKDHAEFSTYRAGTCIIRMPSDGNELDDVRKRAGQVVFPLTSGQVECVWADKTQSQVHPQEIYVIGK